MGEETKAKVLVLEDGKVYEVVASYCEFDIDNSLDSIFYKSLVDGIDYVSETCSCLRYIIRRVEVERSINDWWDAASDDERGRFMESAEDDWGLAAKSCGLSIPEVDLAGYEIEFRFTDEMARGLLEEYSYDVMA